MSSSMPLTPSTLTLPDRFADVLLSTFAIGDEELELAAIRQTDQAASVVEKYAKYVADPVGFASDILHVNLVPLQEKALTLLLEPPYRVLCPSGNEQGKCVEENELITLGDGSRVRAGDLVGTRFRVPCLVDGSVKKAVGIAEWNTTESVYELTTEFGHKIIRNAQHPVWAGRARFKSGMTPRIDMYGWHPVGKLSSDWVVAVADAMPVGSDVATLSDEELKMIAYLIGDGSLTGGNLGFTQQEGDQLEEFKDCGKKLGCNVKSINSAKYGYGLSAASTLVKRRVVAKNGTVSTHNINPVRDLMRRLGLAGKHSRDKFIPDEVFSQPLDKQAIFLSRLFATDGWATVSNKGQPEIGFCSISYRLVRDVQNMMVRFGLHFKLYRRQTVDAWVLSIQNNDQVAKFAERIGIYGKEMAIWKASCSAASNGHQRHRWRYADAPEGTRWEKVVSVRYVGEARTVAIEVPIYHTYLSPIYEHNSASAACAVLWWFCTRSPAVVITTAPNEKQVKDILWKEIRKLARQAKLDLPFLPKDCRIERSPDDFAVGKTARDEASFQGQHGPHQLFIVDEAIGCDPWVIEAIEGMFSPPGHALMALFNPTKSGTWVQQEMSRSVGGGKTWHVVRMSALEHPNIEAELKGDPPVVPHAMRLDKFERLLKKWSNLVGCDPGSPAQLATDVVWPPVWAKEYCERTRQVPKVWRPGPLAESRLLGRFPRQGVNAVWSDGDWIAAVREGLPLLPIPVMIPEIGCDPARFGDDFTSTHVRCGPKSLFHHDVNGQDINATAWFCMQQADTYAMWYNQMLGTLASSERGSKRSITGVDIPIKIDVDGLGAGVFDVVWSAGYFAVAVSAASKPISSHGERRPIDEYPNRRTELWFTTAERARADDIDLSGILGDPANPMRPLLDEDGQPVRMIPEEVVEEMKRQFMTATYTLDNRGRRVVCPKDEQKKELRRSPDMADAINLAYAEVLTDPGVMPEVLYSRHSPLERRPRE